MEKPVLQACTLTQHSTCMKKKMLVHQLITQISHVGSFQAVHCEKMLYKLQKNETRFVFSQIYVRNTTSRVSLVWMKKIEHIFRFIPLETRFQVLYWISMKKTYRVPKGINKLCRAVDRFSTVLLSCIGQKSSYRGGGWHTHALDFLHFGLFGISTRPAHVVSLASRQHRFVLWSPYPHL